MRKTQIMYIDKEELIKIVQVHYGLTKQEYTRRNLSSSGLRLEWET